MKVKNNITSALDAMKKEALLQKKAAEDFLDEVNEMGPEELSFDDLDAGGGEFGESGENGEPSEGAPKIKTVDDAKKVLDEAKRDLQAVVDNLDGITGQAEEEIEQVAYKRVNASAQDSLKQLATQTDAAILDAQNAIKHWAFLKKIHNPAATIKDSRLKQAADTIQEVTKFSKLMEKLFGGNKSATAVPPTGANFSGDKFEGGKDPKEIEDRAWHSGAEKFKRDKSFEDSRVNPAVDNRLNTSEYSRDEKPYVNASFNLLKDNKFASNWDILDSKTNKRIIVSFAALPDKIGERNDNTFNIFKQRSYGEEIINTIAREGIETTRKVLGGAYADAQKAGIEATASLDVIAKDPKLKDKSVIRKYYTDMFGDAEYARKLTSSRTDRKPQRVAPDNGSAPGTDMNIGYDPKDKHPKDKKTDNVKDGPGKLSTKVTDPAVIKAKAKKAVEVARKFAAAGAIAFTKTAIMTKSRELIASSDEQFKAIEATLSQMPIKNQVALVEAHIPDTETGIVGNPSTGVSEPNSKVNTEGLDSKVKSDASFASRKVAGLVPQMSGEGVRNLKIVGGFNNITNRLARKGVNAEVVLKKPQYRGK